MPIATGEATLGIAIIAMTGIKAIIFFGGIALAGAYLLPNDLSGWIARIPVIGRYGVRDLLAAGQGEHSTLTVMLIALLVGLLAIEFGFHPAVGAYMAGLIFREEYFLRDQKTTRDSYKKTKTIVDNAAFSWIGPIFFVDLGTKILFDLELLNAIIPQVMILFTSLFVVQIGSAALAARYLGNYTFHESIIIGFGMLGRAELAFVVMDIAYIQNDIFSTEVFYTLMCTAFLLNTAVPLSLTLFKPSYDRAQREKSASPTV